MKIVKKKLDGLKKSERNVRMHTEKQLHEFRRSVEMFGQIRPIVIDENNVILAGNGLYEALRAMGRTEADCHIAAGLTEAAKKKLMLADNRIFTLGVDDYDTLDAFLLELKDDLDIPGFDEDILKNMVADVDVITDAMSGYGKLSPDEAASVAAAGERKREAIDTAEAAKRSEGLLQQPQTATETPPTITCPECGAVICL